MPPPSAPTRCSGSARHPGTSPIPSPACHALSLRRSCSPAGFRHFRRRCCGTRWRNPAAALLPRPRAQLPRVWARRNPKPTRFSRRPRSADRRPDHAGGTMRSARPDRWRAFSGHHNGRAAGSHRRRTPPGTRRRSLRARCANVNRTRRPSPALRPRRTLRPRRSLRAGSPRRSGNAGWTGRAGLARQALRRLVAYRITKGAP